MGTCITQGEKNHGGIDIHAEYWQRDGPEAGGGGHRLPGEADRGGGQGGLFQAVGDLSGGLSGAPVCPGGGGHRTGVQSAPGGDKAGPEGLQRFFKEGEGLKSLLHILGNGGIITIAKNQSEPW